MTQLHFDTRPMHHCLVKKLKSRKYEDSFMILSNGFYKFAVKKKTSFLEIKNVWARTEKERKR